MEEWRFDTVLRQVDDKDAAFIEIPFDVPQTFGAKRVKVVATFDGEEYRGSIVTMGGGAFILGVPQAVRRAIGKGPGDTVAVVLRRDEQPRVVTLGDDARAALVAAEAARAAFDALSYSHQRQYHLWIEEAKTDATRQKRIQSMVEKLKQGKTHK